MSKKKRQRRTTDATKIFYNRYIKGRPNMLKALREERIKADVIQWIYDKWRVDITGREDELDLKAARKAMKEPGKDTPWKQAKKDFGLDDD